MSAQRVVTLPPSEAAPEAFARRAQREGAQLLEIRSDLQPATLDLAPLARVLPLLVAQRGAYLPASWVDHARWVDTELPDPAAHGERTLWSWHSGQALAPEEALAAWKRAAPPGAIKHVEPLVRPGDAERLRCTQALLLEAFGADRVTVLATGALALPTRIALAERNALDYLALDPSFRAAPGQRLLGDAVRASRGRSARGRLGIIGTGIAGSRSPRIHAPPFDRLELPADAPLDELLAMLVRDYRGLAVTSPFKRAAARAVGARHDAVNTLVRTQGAFCGENTDVYGARAVLERLPPGPVLALGDGGATWALRQAALTLERSLEVVRRAEADRTLCVPCVWTWPPAVGAPAGLRFSGVPVAVVAYGAAGRAVEEEIRRRGGQPLRLGARWFVAQARGQRWLWEDAE